MAMQTHTNHSVRLRSVLSVITETHKVTPNMLSTPRTAMGNVSVLFLPTASSEGFLTFPVRKSAIRNLSTFIWQVSRQPVGKHGAVISIFFSAQEKALTVSSLLFRRLFVLNVTQIV